MEELKMIVEVVSKISGDASNVVILYFVKDFLTSILVAVSVVVPVYLMFNFIIKLVDADSKFAQIRKALGSANWGDTDLNAFVFGKIIEKIEELKEDAKK